MKQKRGETKSMANTVLNLFTSAEVKVRGTRWTFLLNAGCLTQKKIAKSKLMLQGNIDNTNYRK